MTVHSCRDLRLGDVLGAATGSYDTAWAITVFLQGILGYALSSFRTGSVPFPVYADTTIPYYSATQTGPNSWTYALYSSSILSKEQGTCFFNNLGPGKETYVQFSTDAMNLSAAAYPIGYPNISASFPVGPGLPFRTGSWLVAKSNEYPLANSGIYVITGVSINDNAVIVDYRAASGSFPTTQTGSMTSASFWLPPPGSDRLGLGRTGGVSSGFWRDQFVDSGSGTGYRTSGSVATWPRAIYNAPSSSLGYQVRVCLEGRNDRGLSEIDPGLTIVPGFNGVDGDYSPGRLAGALNSGSLHLHVPQWYNSGSAFSPYNYVGYTPGVDSTSNQANVLSLSYVRHRLYMWGDDQTGTCLIYMRGESTSVDAHVMFGQPEDEPVPDPTVHPIQRLFVIGATHRNEGTGADWKSGVYNEEGVGGSAYSLDLRAGPISCVMAPLIFVAGMNTYAFNPAYDRQARFDVNGGDCPFLSSSELVPVDLLAGTLNHQYIRGGVDSTPFEPRRMGHVPIARLGPGFGKTTWYPADTDKTWFHVKNGVYLPWGGTTPLS